MMTSEMAREKRADLRSKSCSSPRSRESVPSTSMMRISELMALDSHMPMSASFLGDDTLGSLFSLCLIHDVEFGSKETV